MSQNKPLWLALGEGGKHLNYIITEYYGMLVGKVLKIPDMELKPNDF